MRPDPAGLVRNCSRKRNNRREIVSHVGNHSDAALLPSRPCLAEGPEGAAGWEAEQVTGRYRQETTPARDSSGGVVKQIERALQSGCEGAGIFSEQGQPEPMSFAPSRPRFEPRESGREIAPSPCSAPRVLCADPPAPAFERPAPRPRLNEWDVPSLASRSLTSKSRAGRTTRRRRGARTILASLRTGPVGPRIPMLSFNDFRQEIEQFFLDAAFFEDKNARILGWDGPDEALALVQSSSRRFAGARQRGPG